MEKIKEINGQRIEWCCAEYGISIRQLAKKIHLQEETIEELIAGTGKLTFNQLKSMADYFGRGVLFFLDPNPVDETLFRTLQFRTIANQKPEISPRMKLLIERVERQRDIYLSLRSEMLESETPVFSPPQLPAKDINKASRTARKWLGMGRQADFSEFRANVEAKGILVFQSNGYAGKWQIAKESPILGFELYFEDCPVIFVRKQAYDSMQMFTLAHELAHILLHKTSSIDDNRDFESTMRMEREANSFAGQLLVPDDFLAEIDDEVRPDEIRLLDDWLKKHKKVWGVSGEVILRRLLDVGRLSQEMYSAYHSWRSAITYDEKEGGSRKYRHREPGHMFGDAFVRTVFDAYYAQRISLTKTSAYLDNLKISDVHQLENYYAGL